MTDDLERLEDPVEAEIQKMLIALGCEFSTEFGSNGGPDFSVKGGPTIECKRFYSDRAIKQMAALDQAILVQGLDAARWLSSAIVSLIQRVREADSNLAFALNNETINAASYKLGRAEALEEAAKWHEAKITRLEDQIEHNNEYARRSGNFDGKANDFCRSLISNYRSGAAALRALKDKPNAS